MTLHPVLPPLILALIAAALLTARLITFRRLRRAAPSRAAMWRWAAVSSAAALLVLAAARPVFGDDGAPPRVAGETTPNVFIVLDQSAEMDMPAARDDVDELLDRHPDARFALIGFTSRPSLVWPLSADTWSLRSVVAAMTASGTDAGDVGAAANVLRYQLIGAAQHYPRARNLVYYLGTGVSESGNPPREFDLPEGEVSGGAVVGYSPAGVESLQAVADQIGVPFVPRFDGAVLPADTGPAQEVQAAQTAAGERIEVYWGLAAAASVLVLAELFMVLREFRRTRMPVGQVLP
ncbi:vWA domain-containing protein [Mycobacterium sp. ACS4331]|uniref:vWA domain-containing protein n=1 Tax=Mycobacterium sp. ACS4331 TaxID=1834121 RepID=UPI0007FDD0A9|nr:vWA domain-containing protein [Mycobacterium sp. ACS4331]OBF13398.1 hypothetical protein A5727_17230 [Mycobacterium sp. ACS4331]